MMFGHLENNYDRISHLVKIRDVQDEKPENSSGFISFTCWPFQSKGTRIEKKHQLKSISPEDYLRTVAISRILLTNITNIQASWLTVGKATAQLCLHAGANDLGSVMIEENVVSSAGVNNKIRIDEMKSLICSSGFKPQLRDQEYNYL
jgi:cyclic dehypoxanthinyl futalosine synthase